MIFGLLGLDYLSCIKKYFLWSKRLEKACNWRTRIDFVIIVIWEKWWSTVWWKLCNFFLTGLYETFSMGVKIKGMDWTLDTCAGFPDFSWRCFSNFFWQRGVWAYEVVQEKKISLKLSSFPPRLWSQCNDILCYHFFAHVFKPSTTFTLGVWELML